MKQKEITILLVVGFFSAIVALVISNMLISSPKNRQDKVEKVEKITAEFKLPDQKYFNTNSINPTQLIQIGDNPNPQPFTSR